MSGPDRDQEAGRTARLLASLRPALDDSHLVDQAPPMTISEVARRFWPDVRPLRWWLLLLIALLGAAPLITVLEVLLFQRLVDDVLVPATLEPLIWIAALYVGLNLLSAVVSGCDDYLSTWVSQRFLVKLRTQVFSHVLAHPGHVHDRKRLGDTMSRLTSDTAAVESFMIGNLATGTGAVLRLVVYGAALFWLQWQLALVAMVAAPLLWWVATHFSRLVKDVSRERRRRAGSLSAVTEERLSNAALVQTYNRQDDAVRDYHRQNLAIAAAELVGARIRAVFLPMADLAELVGTLAVIAGGTWALATDRLTLGGLMAFLALMVQCYSPLRTLGNLLPALYSATAGVERMVELLDEELPRDAPGARDLAHVRGEVTLSGVTVRYPGASRDALHGASLHVAAGELVALVGPSGAGKSTDRPVAHPPRRPGRRHGHHRRPRRPRPDCPVSPGSGHAGAAGDLADGRDHRREHRLRPARRRRCTPSTRRPDARTPTGSSTRSRTATTPGSASGAARSRAVSASGSPWPARCCATRRSCSSTSRPPGWTPRPRAGCSTRWPATGRAARSSWPPTTRSCWSTSTASSAWRRRVVETQPVAVAAGDEHARARRRTRRRRDAPPASRSRRCWPTAAGSTPTT